MPRERGVAGPQARGQIPSGLRDQVRLRPQATLRQAGGEGARQDRGRVRQEGRGLPHGEDYS